MRMLVLTTWLIASCTGIDSSLIGGGAKASDNKPNDSGRPSDNTEGVPGYLTDPLVVDVRRDGDGFTVEAPAGTVAANDGSPADVRIHVFEVERDELDDAKATSVRG